MMLFRAASGSFGKVFYRNITQLFYNKYVEKLPVSKYFF